MLRLPDRLRQGLAEALMSWLVATALALPALRLLSLWPERGYALWSLLLLSALLSLLARLRRLPRLIASLALLGGLLWWALSSGLSAALGGLMGALVTMQPASHLVQLYSDLLITTGAITLVLFARLLMQGEPAFSAPMLLSSVLMLWFSGARQQLTDFLPAIFAMPLLFVYAGFSQEGPRAPAAPRRSLLRALPVALVISLLALMLTPGVRTTDPGLERQADRLRQYINDHFFFTSSRENFSLASEGYQPMGPSGLGGRPQVSQARVMQVETDRKVYLRGTMLDRYSGRQWFDSLSNERYGYSAARFAATRDRLLDATLPEKGLRPEGQQVVVSLLGDLPSTLFTPQRVRSLSLSDGMVPYLNASSELFITRNLQPGDRYTVGYEPYVGGTQETDALAERLRGQEDEGFALQPGEYLQLPRHLEPGGAIERLAREIAGNERDPYFLALRIRNHLRDRYRYTLDVPPAPENRDFAQHFLFETGEGYCTYFATAMTVLCRSLSLPARYVEGFVALPTPDGSPAVITGQQAHAWTEVYVPAMGWVVFDATATTGELPPQPDQEGNSPDGGEAAPSPPPGEQPPEGGPEQEEPQQTDQPQDGATPPPEDQPLPSPSPEPEQAPEPQDTPEPGRRPPPSFAWLWWLLLAALAALFAWRARESAPQRRALREKDPGAQLLIYWQGFVSVKAMQGQAMLSSETIRGYARRIAEGDPGLPVLADAVSAVVYGRSRQAEPEQLLAARLNYHSAYQKLPPWKRLLLVLNRTIDDIRLQLRLLVKKLRGLLWPARKR